MKVTKFILSWALFNDEKQRRFSSGFRATIGRDEKCDIVLPTNNVSRTHAEIIFQDDRAVISNQSKRSSVRIPDKHLRLRYGESYTFEKDGYFSIKDIVFKIAIEKKRLPEHFMRCSKCSNYVDIKRHPVSCPYCGHDIADSTRLG